MRLIDKVVQHYDAKGKLKIEVPEWADEEFDGCIYYTPVTLIERNKLMPELKKENLDFIVAVIVMKAEDEDGNKLFDLKDKLKLKQHADYHLLDNLANQILQGVTVEEVGER
jgi:hypothetical protein